MSEVTFGIKLTADGTEVVGAAKASSDAIDKLGASTKSAQSEAEKFNTAQSALATTLNAASQNAEEFNGQSSRLVEEYKQLTSSSDAWAAAQQRSSEELARSEAALARNAAATAEYKARIAETTLANSASSAEITKLLDRYDTQGAKLRALTTDFNKLMAAADTGGVGGRDEARLALAYAALQKEMAAAGGAATALGVASGEASAAAIGHAAATEVDTVAVHTNSRAVSESLVLMREGARGNFSRMAGSASIMANALGVLPAILSPVGIAIGAVAVAGAGLAYAFNKGAEDSVVMNRALVLTSNYAGQTSDSMNTLARSMADGTNLTIGEAKQVATEVAASGKISAGAYNEVTRLVGLYSDATGVAADKSSAYIIKLFSDPAKGAVALNSTMHFLTDTEIRRIDTLQRTGDMVGAQTVLADAYTKKLQEQANELGNLESAYITVKKAFSDFADAMMSWGKKSTTVEAIAQAKAELIVLQEKSSVYSNMIPELVRQGEINGHIATIAALQKTLSDEHLKTVKDTTAAQKNQVDNAAAAAVSSFEASSKQLDKQEKISQQIAYQKTLREQEKTLTGDELAAKDALLQGSIKYVASLEKEKAVKKDPVIAWNSSKMKEIQNAMDTATGKTLSLTKAQTDLLETMNDPRWAKSSDQWKIDYVAKIASASATEELNKSNADYQKMLDGINKSGAAEVGSLNRAIDAQRLHNDEIGKTPAQIELVKAAIADQAELQADSDAQYLDGVIARMQADQAWADANPQILEIYQARAAALHEIASAQQSLNSLQQQGSVNDAVAAATRQQAANLKALWTTVEQTGKSVFIGLLSNGRNAMAGIGQAIQASIIDLLYQITAKQWFISIGASITGVGVSGAASAAAGVAGGSSGVGSWLSAGSSIYDAITGGFTSLSTYVTSAVQGASLLAATSTSNTAIQGAATSIGNAAGAIGTAASYIGAGMAGITIGSMIGGDKKVIGMDATTASAIGAAIGAFTPLGPLGAVIGGALGGMFDAAFGSGPKVSGTTTLAGNFSQAGFAGQYQTPWSQSGGWFSSGSSGIDTQGVGAAQSAALQATVAGTKSVFDNLIAASGDAQKSLAGWTFAINRQVATQAQQNALVIDIANSMGTFLIPSLSALQKTGENLADTAVRLKDEITLTNTVVKLLGKNISTAFGQIGIASLAARDNLVTLMGGLTGMNSTMQSYYNNFFTASERHANDLGNLTLQFASLGFTIPTTAAGFKDLVQAQDLSTASGQTTFAALMKLNGAFASLVQTADQAAAAVQANITSLQAAALANYNAAKSGVDTLRAFSLSVRDLQASLLAGIQSPAGVTASGTRAVFTSTNAAAAAGDVTAQGKLSGAATAFLDAAKSQASSAADYAKSFAFVQSALSDTATKTGVAVTVADQQLQQLAEINGWVKATATGVDNIAADGIKAKLDTASTVSVIANTSGMPADIRTTLTSQTKSFNVMISAAFAGSVSPELQRVMIDGAGNYNATVIAALGLGDPSALKLATQAGATYLATVNAALGLVDPAAKTLALTAGGNYLATVSAALGVADPVARTLALNTANTVMATVTAALGSANSDALRLATTDMSTLATTVTASLGTDAGTSSLGALLAGATTSKITVDGKVVFDPSNPMQSAFDLMNASLGAIAGQSAVQTTALESLLTASIASSEAARQAVVTQSIGKAISTLGAAVTASGGAFNAANVTQSVDKATGATSLNYVSGYNTMSETVSHTGAISGVTTTVDSGKLALVTAEQKELVKTIAEQSAAIASVNAGISAIYALAGKYGMTLQTGSGAAANFSVNPSGLFSSDYGLIRGNPNNFAGFKSAFYAAGGVYDQTYAQQGSLITYADTIANLKSLLTSQGAVPGHADGLSYVPYDDYHMRAHKGEAVMDAATISGLRKYGVPVNNQSGGNNDAMVAELQALRTEVAALRKSSSDTAGTNKRIADLLLRVTRDGDSLVTVPA